MKIRTGYHPAGIIVVPREREVYEFTPIQYSEDEPNSNIITTHFDYHYLDYNLDDKETLNMICSANTIGIPELETDLVRNIILEIKPTTFDDLIKILNLIHSTDVWENNAQDVIKNGTATLNEIINCRDDIMTYLMSKGIDDRIAYNIMEFVRKGRANTKKMAFGMERIYKYYEKI